MLDIILHKPSLYPKGYRVYILKISSIMASWESSKAINSKTFLSPTSLDPFLWKSRLGRDDKCRLWILRMSIPFVRFHISLKASIVFRFPSVLALFIHEDGLKVFPAVFYKFMPDPMWSHAIHLINLLRHFVIK